MDSRRLEDLVPEAAEKARQVKSQCEGEGFGLLIYSTLRTLQDQAVLFRQSQPQNVIDLKIEKLRSSGYDFLADIILQVGPQQSLAHPVTNAGPGESWHNFAEAWDAVPQVDGHEMWKYEAAPQAWESYGRFVREAGMTWGGDWTKFPDRPHAQLRADSNPLRVLSPQDARAVLRSLKLLP
jgi:peptidoglycan L-alanyl-D-glutamate endopeptidase CwlK